MLATLTRSLRRRGDWAALCSVPAWCRNGWEPCAAPALLQAAGLAKAAGSGSASSPADGSSNSSRLRGSRGSKGAKFKQRRSPAASQQDAASGSAQQPAGAAAAAPSAEPGQLLGQLVGRFKSKASSNDAAGAEHYYRQYIQAGGEPQSWMLAMLIGTYGRLRQADKAWALYCALAGRGAGAAGAAAAAAGEDAEAAAAAGQLQQPEAAGAGGRGAGGPEGSQLPWPASLLRRDTQQAQQAQQQQQQQLEPDSEEGGGRRQPHAWDARLAQRQRQLAAWAAGMVADLRLDAQPLNEYCYGAVITALSRAEHPPYDLPAHYAARAASVFSDMAAAGVAPNLVLWHNLLDCQAKAGLPDAAFETYRCMRAAGEQPNPWTFSMLVSACGRARQPHRAAEVVQRLMPQAGVAPSLTVWNSLLGAYGRAGSVDAAYAAWLAMLESGAVPDDCTERVLALAFGSHPALAAEVVAEARAIRQQRQAAAAAAAAVEAEAAAAAAGTGAQQEQQAGRQAEGPAGAAGGEGQGGGPADGGRTTTTTGRPPYRLHQHRQSSLQVDRIARRGGAAGLLGGRSAGAAAAGAAATAADAAAAFDEAASEGGGDAAAAVAAAQEGQGDGPAVRQLLSLDLHGSSQAAARMVLLRRLEALVLAGPELEAEVAGLEAQHHARLAPAPPHQAQQQQAQAQQAGEVLEETSWQLLGAGEEEGALPVPPSQAQQAQRAQRAQRSPGPPFEPPALNVITGLGRHSRSDRGGVLKAAVRELLQQQGLPALDDPSNDGVVVVPWPALREYLSRQRRAMETDHFFSAARLRYLYVLCGVAGLAAASNLLPRLAPWME